MNYTSTKGYGVTVTRSERWAWDKEELEKYFGQTEPQLCEQSISVDREVQAPKQTNKQR